MCVIIVCNVLMKAINDHYVTAYNDNVILYYVYNQKCSIEIMVAMKIM
jgi:hypothetical protein